jgi:hypothetical protein
MICKKRGLARPAIRYLALSTPRNALPGLRDATGSSDVILEEPEDPQASWWLLQGCYSFDQKGLIWSSGQPKSLFALKEN